MHQNYPPSERVKNPLLPQINLSQFSRVNMETLPMLGFNYDGEVWVHHQEYSFSIRLERSSFYVVYQDKVSADSFALTIGELAKQFYKKTGLQL